MIYLVKIPVVAGNKDNVENWPPLLWDSEQSTASTRILKKKEVQSLFTLYYDDKSLKQRFTFSKERYKKYLEPCLEVAYFVPLDDLMIDDVYPDENWNNFIWFREIFRLREKP